MTAFDLGPGDVLLVADVQRDFCAGGALAVPGGDEVVRPINRLVARFPAVVLVQDWHPPGHVSFASSHPGRRPYETVALASGPQVLWPDHCVAGSVGAALHAELHTDRAQAIVRKGHHVAIDAYSAFFENDHATPTGLAGYLRDRGLRRVVVVGLAADFCVAWSALDARRLGLDVVVVDDATRALDVDGSLARARADLAAAGVVRAVVDDLVG